MTDENSEEIKKPWVIYNRDSGPWGIGKIVEESKNSYNIQFFEDQTFPPQSWDKDWTDSFNTPKEAIDYFLIHSPEYSRKELIDKFLENFPNEAVNLEDIIAQSQP